MLRTHDLGSLRSEHIGQTVTLAGWVGRRRDHGGVAFVDLRDASGVAQVVVREEEVFHGLRNEYVLQIVGTVSQRPEGNENPALPTGEIEVMAEKVTILNTSDPLPFQIDEHVEVGEEARLKHRYLDLRRPGPARNLRLRSEANRVARELLHQDGYVEIETPTLTRSTPEGARDFVVPARLAPGSWYALPQSPQLFKQLLQVGGFEKYYQIARCYRDEDFRADRQPEFTQLDIEASFVEQDDIISLGENIVKALWKLIDVEIPTPIQRITYHDAMARYGSDKPDLRFGLELTELTEFFKDTNFGVFKAPYVGAVVMPGGASQARRALDAWQEWAKQRGAKGLAYVLYKEDGELAGPVAKNLTDTERAGLADAVGAKPGDCIFFAAGEKTPSRALLGAARVEIGHRTGLINPADWAFCWVVDAPMFEPAAAAVASGDVAVGAGKWTAVHHAFTSPKPEFMDTLRPGSRVGAVLRLRHRLQRQRNRRRLDPYPRARRPGAGLRAHGPGQGRRPDQVRLPAGGLQVRRPSARRHRLRLGPRGCAAGRRGVHPRRHRVPEVRRRLRPPDPGPRADHGAAAQGSRRRFQARGQEGPRRQELA